MSDHESPDPKVAVPLASSFPGCRDSSEQILNAEVERVVLGGPRSGVGPLSRRDVQRLETPRKTVPVSDAASDPKLVEHSVAEQDERLAVSSDVDRAGEGDLRTV